MTIETDAEFSALIAQEDEVAYEREMLVRLTPSLSAISVMNTARHPDSPHRENMAPFIFLSVSVWAAIIIGVVLTLLGVRALLYGPK
jgi:hypothetical protein